MARVCFQTIAFQSAEFIEAAIESVAPFGPIVATEGPVGYWRNRGFDQSEDGTMEILARHCRSVAYGCWREKDEMARAGAALVPPDTTHVFWFDADEVWHPATLANIIARLDDIDSAAFRFDSFWCGFDHVMTGFEAAFPVTRIQRWYPGATWATHRPPTVLNASGVPYRDMRHLDCDATDALGPRCCHYSYCLPDQTRRKWEYYHDRDTGACIPDWYQRVYLAWANGDAAARADIERRYLGVHNWTPARRHGEVGIADCYTARFHGEHPPSIARRLPMLRARFAAELESVNRSAT
jgi:hypothetical protein